MKQLIITLLAVITLSFNGWTALSVSTNPSLTNIEKADNPVVARKNDLRVAQMKLFIELTPEKYGQLRGKKLNIFERFSFKSSQRRMKKMLKYYEYGDEPTTLQKISWLLKGLILGPIALLIGYIFLKDEQRELIKWIWFGFVGFAAIILVVLLTL